MMKDAALAMRGRWPEEPAAAERAREDALLCRCRQGDESGYRELLQRYRAPAVYVAAQLLRDPTEAEDVVQEAFMRVLRSLHQYRGEASFYSWFYRIVINLCMDRLRRAARHPTVPLDEETDDAPAAWDETRLQVEALLARLSPEMKVTLLLREVGGLSYEEIALELGVPIGTVRSRLSAAREQFRRLWTAMEAEEEPR
jgi:RNA polymerase sigma-70 factor (ECF subfamily)